MGWLVESFDEQSILWLVISTVVALVAGVASSWLSYRFVTRQQIIDTIVADVEKQRSMLSLETQKEKEERIRREVIRWANPILGAVQDLESRLGNILHNNAYPALSEGFRVEAYPGWSISHEYFMNSTLYLFSQYFAWIRMLQEDLSFELFESHLEKDEFLNHIADVASALADFPPKKYSSCTGEDTEVFRLQQRAIGELMMLNENDQRRCLTYPEFLQRLNEPQFCQHIEPLRTLLKDLNKPKDECRWKRLEATNQALVRLRVRCEELVGLPPQS